MVLTIQPGIYARPVEGVPIKFWNIGIGIEDGALVITDRCALMTRAFFVGLMRLKP